METIGALTKQVTADVWGDVAGKAAQSGGMDPAAFSELLFGFWAGLGRSKEPTEAQVKVWYYCLHDLTPGQFAHAIGEFLTKHGDEFPAISRLRELSGATEAKDAAALAAWTATLDAIRHQGGYRSPEFSDPVISHVVESFGGWIELTGRTTDDLHKFVRPQFLKAYAALAGQARTRQPVPMKNLIDQANTDGRIGYDQVEKLAVWNHEKVNQ